jgi:hypothetical protein
VTKYNPPVTRTRRKHVATCTIVLLLFMQAVTSAYACVFEVGTAPVGQVTDANAAAMPCHEPAPEPSNRCQAHCVQATQTVDNRAAVKLDVPALTDTVAIILPLLHQPAAADARGAATLPISGPPPYLELCRFLN